MPEIMTVEFDLEQNVFQFTEPMAQADQVFARICSGHRSWSFSTGFHDALLQRNPAVRSLLGP